LCFGEGQIPNEAKSFANLSFPCIRDWLNEHPFKITLEATLICNLHTGGTWRTMTEQLKKKIIRLLHNGSITVID